MARSLLAPCSIIRVQTWDSLAAAPSRLEQALGIAWPNETGACLSGRVEIICAGPTDWLVIAPDPDGAELLQRLDEALVGSPFRATNVSQALSRFEIDGPEARVLLAKGCSLDLHPSHFPPCRCARTRFAGMPMIVRCIRQFTFECIVTSSYADYLRSWLTDAAIEFSRTLA